MLTSGVSSRTGQPFDIALLFIRISLAVSEGIVLDYLR